MTELELYKFIVENDIEYSWHNEDVIIWIKSYHLDYWFKLFNDEYNLFSEGKINCVLQNDGIAVEMEQICGYFGIKLESIFKKD